MNIFVTGASGFSGYHVVDYLMKNNYNLTALMRQENKENKLLKNENINFIYKPLEDLKFLPDGIDIIIHSAAVSPMEKIKSADFIQSNIVATHNLVHLAKKHKVKKFIFFSTVSVYGEINDLILNEASPIINPNNYGLSKLMSELCLKDASSDMMSLAIRFPAIIGKGAKRHWLANTLNKALLNQDINIFNPDSYFNNAVHIQEICKFIESLFSKEWSGFDVINISSSGGITINNIINMIIKKTGSSSQIIKESSPKHHFTICHKKAERIYGYRPIPFEEALQNYLSDSIT